MLHIKQSQLVNRYGENDQSTTENKVSSYYNTNLCYSHKVCQENNVNRPNNNN